MRFKDWLITEILVKVNYLPDNILQSIQHLVGGNWKWVKPPRTDLPYWRYQWRITCEAIGQNVRMDGDRFYLKVFIQCFKKTEWSENPPLKDHPPGYYGGQNWWGPSDSLERLKKTKEYGKPEKPLLEVDPVKGHPLLWFSGFLEGWRPGMMPGTELDYQTSAEIKGYPISVSKPGDFRHDMERIGSFDEESVEQGPWKDNRVRTPFEVAQYVKQGIDHFYGPRGGDNDDEPIQPTTPSPTSRKVKI